MRNKNFMNENFLFNDFQIINLFMATNCEKNISSYAISPMNFAHFCDALNLYAPQ